MFISTAEKESLTRRIAHLEDRVGQLARSLNALLDAKSLAPNPGQLVLREVSKKEKTRAKRNAYARAYYHRKKAEKAKEAK